MQLKPDYCPSYSNTTTLEVLSSRVDYLFLIIAMVLTNAYILFFSFFSSFSSHAASLFHSSSPHSSSISSLSLLDLFSLPLLHPLSLATQPSG